MNSNHDDEEFELESIHSIESDQEDQVNKSKKQPIGVADDDEG